MFILSPKNKIPKNTLVIGSKVPSTDAVVAPQYFTPYCKNTFPKIVDKNAINIDRNQAVVLIEKVNLLIAIPKAKNPTTLNKLIYKLHLNGSIYLNLLLSK